MFIVKVEKGNLDAALKKLKSKVFTSGIMNELNERKAYKSKSEKKKESLSKWRRVNARKLQQEKKGKKE